jgi:hypothetical protein
MADIKLPAPQQQGDLKSTVDNLYDTVLRLRKELEYILLNLDDSNILSVDYAKIKNLEAMLITAEFIDAVAAEIDIIVSNTTITNILSAQTANIAELTVDRIETSDKVQRYDQPTIDKTDVEYWRGQDQFIQFLTAEYVGDVGGVVQTENVYDRFDNQLFWLDAEHTGITDDGIKYPDYPVKQLVYDELVKLEIAFEEIDGVKQPYIALGAGVDVEDYPNRGKLFIKKDTVGGYLEYTDGAGHLYQLRIGYGGITTVGNTGPNGIRNIAIGATQPTSPQNNDLWIDTDA